MTVLGVGVDVVGRSRFARSAAQPGFLDHVLCADERAAFGGEPDRAAAAFAIKEAVVKALGTGAWRQGVDFPQILVRFGPGPIAAPVAVTLAGAAAAHAAGPDAADAETPPGVRCAVTRAGDRWMAIAVISRPA